MASTKSAILYTLIIFYGILGIFMLGYGNLALEADSSYTPEYTAVNKNLTDNAKFDFIPAVTKSYKDMPVFINIVVFLPIFALLLYLIVTTIGGAIFDGGA